MDYFLVSLRDSSVLFLQNYFGLSRGWANLCQSVLALLIVLFLSWTVGKIGRWLMRKYVPYFTMRTKNKWDDKLVDNKVFVTLSYYLFGLMFICVDEFIAAEGLRTLIKNLTGTYFTIVTITLINNLLNSAYDIYLERKEADKANLKIYIQVVKVLLYSIGVIIVVSYFADKNFMDILKGLGAMLTILLIVYKDSIMGFVAGINLSAYKMMEVGDWIVAPKHNADGVVLEIGLSAVKVQNWDNTITTIPPYSLVSDSFTNWKGMEQSGGRRIKRSINIDVETIRFLSKEQLKELSEMPLLKDFFAARKDGMVMQVDADGKAHSLGALTNVDVFMHYIENYVRSTGFVHPDMTCMVRQLQPTELGLPVEIYFFSKEQRWVFYEQLQASIFSHILATANQFGLRIYQRVSSHNVEMLSSR